MGRYADHVSISYVLLHEPMLFFSGELEKYECLAYVKQKGLVIPWPPAIIFCQPSKHMPKEFVPLSKHILEPY